MKTRNDYPILRTMVERAPEVTVSTAIGAFVLGVLLGARSPGQLLGVAMLGVGAAAAVKNLTELNEIISETLLPQ